MNACLRKPFLVFMCSSMLIFAFPIPKAKAFEPVSMSVLAAIAMPYAIQAAKYTAQGLIRTGPCWLNQGLELLNILRLPLGLLEITIGAPFGFFWSGLQDTWKGAISPFMFLLEFFELPLYFFGYK